MTSGPAWPSPRVASDVWCLSRPREAAARPESAPRLLTLLATTYPSSVHVRDVGLATADDETVWRYAAEHDLVIVSKDADFHQRSFLYGHPPKVVWIRRGNCSTDDVAALLRNHEADLTDFASSEEAAFLALG